MKRSSKLLLGAGGVAAGALALWTAWGLRSTRSVEEVPYETVDEFDGVEIRQYPRTVLVETTAPNERTAFGRLFRYIDGNNEAAREIAMTAPVETRERSERSGTEIPMTAPVRTDETGDGVTMAFYLPAEYGPGDAPVPTDSSVRLVVEPPRTVAVYSFSWIATDGRVRSATDELLSALAERGVDTVGEPSLLRYDDPRTPPFLRTNEVVVEVEDWA